MKKRLFGALLGLCMALALLPGLSRPALAAELKAWDGTSDTSWYSDSRASFTITTPEQLAGLAELVNGGEDFSGKTIILGSDLDLGGLDWTPIGTHIIYDTPNSTNDRDVFLPFQGVFDGGGHTISGLYINTNPVDVPLNGMPQNVEIYISVGLFAYVGGRGTVENLSVSGMVSCARSEEGDRALWNLDYAGGVVGYNGGTVRSCSNSADVYGGGAAGGVVGYSAAFSGMIERCSNTGSISARSVSDCYAGGIVGFYSYNEENGIADCFNSGSVRAEEWSKETAHIANCAKAAGGIAGGCNALIRNCYNSGSVLAGSLGSESDRDPCSVGGIVGIKQNPGTVENCCNYGNLSISYGGSATYSHIGGIAGTLAAVDYALYEESGTVEVKNCCSKCTITMNSSSPSTLHCSGGIVGYARNGVINRVLLSITNCYWTTALNYGVITRAGGILQKNLTRKGTDAFSSGEIAWYLQNPEKVDAVYAPQEGQVWGQQLKREPRDTSPILTADPDKWVYRVIFLKEKDAAQTLVNIVGTRYANVDGVVSLPTPPGTDGDTPTVWTADGATAFTEYTQVFEDMTVYPAARDSVDNTVTITVTTTYGTPAEERDLGKYLGYQSGTGQPDGDFPFRISKRGGDENTGPEEIAVIGGDLIVPAGVDAGVYTLQITADETAGELNVIVRVNRAAPLKLEDSVTMRWNDTAEVRLTDIPGYPRYPGGEPKLEVEDFTNNGLAGATLAAGVLRLTSGASELPDNASDTVNVKLSDMRNYEDSTITVTVSYQKSETQEPDPPSGEVTTYKITILATANGSLAASRDRAAEGEAVMLTATPEGGYRLVANSLTVTKVGDGSTWNVPVSGKGASGDSYTFTMPAGEVRVSAQFAKPETNGTGSGSGVTNSGTGVTGGGGSIFYTITVAEAAYGKVRSNLVRAEAGTSVRLTVTPDKGYALSALRAADRDGKEVALKDSGGGLWILSMPSSDVTVTAAFAPVAPASPSAAAASNGGRGSCPRDGACPLSRFVDTDASLWYHDGAHYCIENGLMSGVSRLYFAPDIATNRAMFATILYRMEGEPAVGDGGFTDVPADKWYAAPIAWAAANGIMEGFGNGKFRPEEPITREQMAVTLYRYARYKGYDVSAWGDLSAYTDGQAVSGWAGDAMRWAIGEGLVTGISSRIPFLDPAGHATRAQVATILMRFRTGHN